jgi:CubicO group peptidase (beta-lactamase class C family)
MPRLLAPVFLAACFVAPLSNAAEPLAELRPKLEEFVGKGQIAGAVVAIGRQDKVLALEAVGNANLEKQAPMKADTLFRIASMTKPITAIGIMQLADEGKLSVDDPVEKHLSEFRGQRIVTDKSGETLTLKPPSRPITLRDLMTHTSGLPGGPPPGLSDLYVRRNRTLAEGTLVFSQQPLQFEPGSKWAYCNTGIDTLGRVIEVVSGKSFEDFLRERIFEPLGMKDTTFYPNEEQLARAAMTYDQKDGKLVATPYTIVGSPVGAKYAVPAGGLFSTAGDLAKLYQAMLRGGMHGEKRILSEASAKKMTSVQTGDLVCGFTPGMGFGFGWAVVREPQGVTAMLSPGTYGHGGAFGTQGWIDPKQDLFVILLIQRVGLQNADGSDMRREVQTIAVGAVKP